MLEQLTDRHYASMRSVHADSSVRPNLVRMAQLAPNTTYTAPNFYSPWLTPSSYQIPTNRKEVYLWAQWWYDNEPLIASGIDFFSEFPMTDFTLECGMSWVKE